METLAHNSRLDTHEKQIQQLQSDVSKIKTTLQTLEVARGESREFRKDMLNWMKEHEQKTVAGSLGSGANFGEVLPYSRLKSVPDRDFSPKSASDRDLSGGLPSLIAQLEAIVSRSEERLHFGGLEIHYPDGQLDEDISSSNLDLFEIKVLCHDSGVDISNLRPATTTPIFGFTKSENPVDNLQSDLFESSLNPYASFTSFDSDVNSIFVPQVHPSHSNIGSNLLLQTFEWKPGWDFGWLDYTRPPAFALKLFVLDEDLKPPDLYTNLKSDLLWKLFHGWCKTANQVDTGVVGSYHLWVMHGQGRPPEDATKTSSTLDWKLVSQFQS